MWAQQLQKTLLKDLKLERLIRELIHYFGMTSPLILCLNWPLDVGYPRRHGFE